jgi:hypothetical protein
MTCDDLDANPIQKTQTLVADGNSGNLVACSFQLARFGRNLTQHVGIQATAQTLVGRDDDETHRLGFNALGVGQERVRVFRVGCREVGCDITNLVTVGTCRPHPLLRLAHLGRGDHFHRLRDLLRIFYALDLATYLFA